MDLEAFVAFFGSYHGYFLIVIASVFAMFTNAFVQSTFKKYSKQPSLRNFTGAQAAKKVLLDHNVTDVSVERVSGNLTDHYHPAKKTVYLSEGVYDSTSTAAIGVAAHEAGHAVQHAKNYVPLRLRSAIVPVTNFGSRLAFPLIFIGLAIEMSSKSGFGFYLSILGVILYSFCVVFQLVTLPTEFNASRRAMKALETGGILNDEELKGARKTLTAAAMTYVAALAIALLQFLRLFAVVLGGRRKK